MVAHANELKKTLNDYDVPLIINDRVDVAMVVRTETPAHP